MKKSKLEFRLSESAIVLGAFFLGLAGSARAWNEQLWVRQLGTSESDFVSSVATDAVGNVYLTGTTNGSLGGPNCGYMDAWLAKYSAQR